MAGHVDVALESCDAALCGPVLTELRRGLSSAADRKRVLPLLSGCRMLPQPAGLWREVGDLGYAVRRRGVTAKTQDLLIAIYALSHRVQLLAADQDFAEMRRLGIPLQLVAAK